MLHVYDVMTCTV